MRYERIISVFEGVGQFGLSFVIRLPQMSRIYVCLSKKYFGFWVTVSRGVASENHR